MSKIRPNAYSAAQAETLRSANIPNQWGVSNQSGVVIKLTRPPEVVNDALHIWVSIKKQGKELINDGHFVIVNPPTNDSTGAHNPVQAFREIVELHVLRQMGHKL